MGLLGRQRGLQPQEVGRLEALVQLVEGALQAEGAGGAQAPPEPDSRALMAAAEGLRQAARRGAEGQSLAQLVAAVRGALATLERWQGPAAPQPAQPQPQLQAVPRQQQAPPAAARRPVAASPAPPQQQQQQQQQQGPVRQVEPLSPDARTKLQGTMALVLKHSGAFGKGSGPLRGGRGWCLPASLSHAGLVHAVPRPCHRGLI
jgi:hypothetical protein